MAPVTFSIPSLHKAGFASKAQTPRIVDDWHAPCWIAYITAAVRLRSAGEQASPERIAALRALS